MANPLSDIFSTKQEVAGLHIYLQKDGNSLYSLCLLSKEKEEVKIKNTIQSEAWEEILQYIDKKSPLVVCLDGAGVLHKKSENLNTQFQQLFPQINQEDFFIQKALINNSNIFSIIRQEKLEQEFLFLQKEKKFIKSILLGPFITKAVFPFINNTSMIDVIGATINAQSETIELNNLHSEVNSFVLIGEEELPSQFLIAYATALSHWLEAPYLTKGNNASITKYSLKIADRRFAEKITKISLGLIFSLALVNAILYFNLFPKHQTMKLEYESYQTLFERYNGLSGQVKERENIFASASMLPPHFPKSYLADQLASVMPQEINITLLQINPSDEQYKQKERKMRFKEGVIVVKGESKDALAVNNWINNLNKMVWVEKVQGSKYKFDAYKNTGLFEFTIIVKP